MANTPTPQAEEVGGAMISPPKTPEPTPTETAIANEQRGLNNTELAKLVGCSPRTVSDWVKVGQTPPTYDPKGRPPVAIPPHEYRDKRWYPVQEAD